MAYSNLCWPWVVVKPQGQSSGKESSYLCTPFLTSPHQGRSGHPQGEVSLSESWSHIYQQQHPLEGPEGSEAAWGPTGWCSGPLRMWQCGVSETARNG